MPLTVQEIDTTDRRAVDAFIALPFRLYRDCPPWVPPLVGDTRLMLNRRKYPYYAHSDAAFFSATRDGRVVGQIAVLENRNYNAHWKSQTANFYFFDCEDDAEAARGLFAAIEDWARRRGLTKIVGSKGFLQGDGLGVLVEGFEHHPAIGIPYNHAYYGALIEGAGYTRQRDFMSLYLAGNPTLPPRVFEIADRMMARRGFTIKTFETKAELKAWIPRIVQTYNEAFERNWEFNPVTEAEARVIGERLMMAGEPQLIKLVMKGDAIAGFLFGFPDLSDGIRKAKGRLFPFGLIWILREFKRTRWLNLMGAGILAPYRGLGVNAILYAEMFRTIASGRFEHADIVQIEESVLTLDDALRMGARIYKKHRIYEKAL
ncbi:MAG: hypothetical protein K1X39_09220 [Thermoflexales bacterium]|nr:hypothetical protein [Thermoflexales bacterium]